MKEFFKDRKKATIFIVSIVLLIAVIAVITIFATTSFAESGSIGKQNAQNFAFVDAGVAPDEVENLKTEFEFKNGQFIYEVEFDANGTEYDYWIKASDGSIVKKEVDATDDITSQKQQEKNNAQANEQKGNDAEANKSTNNKTETNQTDKQTSGNSQSNNQSSGNSQSSNQSSGSSQSSKQPSGNSQSNKQSSGNSQSSGSSSNNIISLETAKSKALSDAGVSASKATFTKTKLDYDDGMQVYDIEFYTSDNKYEYEINAKTGAVYDKEIEAIKKPSTSKPSGSKPSSGSSSQNSGSSSSYIGVDKAKSIALNHAGVSNVTFEKAKLDRDDGRAVYEIEFYKNGMEYSYEIDAITGRILEYDIDDD